MEIIATRTFIRNAKPLARKYRSFNDDYQKLLDKLSENPHAGIDLSGGYRKVRMAIGSKRKGKSGGCRVITFDLLERNDCLYLLYVYDKSEYDNVEMNSIREIVIELGLESRSDS